MYWKIIILGNEIGPKLGLLISWLVIKLVLKTSKWQVNVIRSTKTSWQTRTFHLQVELFFSFIKKLKSWYQILKIWNLNHWKFRVQKGWDKVKVFSLFKISKIIMLIKVKIIKLFGRDSVIIFNSHFKYKFSIHSKLNGVFKSTAKSKVQINFYI